MAAKSKTSTDALHHLPHAGLSRPTDVPFSYSESIHFPMSANKRGLSRRMPLSLQISKRKAFRLVVARSSSGAYFDYFLILSGKIHFPSR